MKRRGFLGLALAAALPAAADDRYRRRDRDRYPEDFREPVESRRRELLRRRLIDLSDRLRLAERENRISRNRADRLYDRLDRVRDFLRRDRYLDQREFHRRLDDLEEVDGSLRRHR